MPLKILVACTCFAILGVISYFGFNEYAAYRDKEELKRIMAQQYAARQYDKCLLAFPSWEAGSKLRARQIFEGEYRSIEDIMKDCYATKGVYDAEARRDAAIAAGTRK